MIIEIYSDLEAFKTLEFKQGLNILVSQKHKSSGARDSRNGTGKTSMIELLHFLFQLRGDKKDDFHKDGLLDKRFGAKFQGNGQKFDVSRQSGAKKDSAYLDDSPIDFRELQNQFAQQWFGLSAEETAEKYTPKFGSLFSFFARKDRNGGYESAISNSSKQQSWDSQIAIAYLLGFDWRHIQALQKLKDKKKQADNLFNMIKEGYFSEGFLDLKKMQAEEDILKGDVERQRKQIKQFHVVDGYKEYEVKANELTEKLSCLNTENLYDLNLQKDIDAALSEVEDVKENEIEAIYRQINVYFAEQVKKRFEDVQEFHKQITKNRREQLFQEKEKAKQRITERRRTIDELQIPLKDNMDILKSGIALERMMSLQTDLTKQEAKLSDLQIQIPRLRDAEANKERLQREIDARVNLIGDDVQERGEQREFATRAFAEVSRYLYEENGILSLGKTSGIGGLDINIEIKAKKSGGKNHMQIFCFDWVLAQAALRQDKFPGFLVHDSHIFDGVDGRQIGLALRFAKEKCEELGIQYIAAINSDDLEKIKSAEEESGENIFDPDKFILDTRLSDDETGGLFGFRF